jgi:diaminohydroxyphosphoribosylaminopyrimidine deaminase/5-amino-6-(5-phosphoribosylamino)uracil reductase
VLWECGPELGAAALKQGCIQEIAAIIAPKLLGGTPAHTALGELGLVEIKDAIKGEITNQYLRSNDKIIIFTII